MRENFKGNISRIGYQAREYRQILSQQSLLRKMLVIMLAFLTVPNLQIIGLSIVPIIVSLFFINDGLKGSKRGGLAFALATISQSFSIYILLLPLRFTEPVESLDLFSKLRIITGLILGGILLLTPIYLLGLLVYDIKIKKPEGKLYMKLCGGLAILLAIWTIVMVLF